MGDVVMPSLGEDMQEGTIVRWLKSDGDEVSRGDGLVEIETDKASETYDAEDEGVLEIVAGEGASVAVGEVIARLGGGGNGNGATADDEQDEDEEEPEEDQAGNGEHPPGPATDSGDPEASPVARRMAEEEGIALAEVEGSGPGGKVVKADVEGANPASGKGTVEVRELTGVQRRLARRMAESKATVPDFVVRAEVDMGRALAAHDDLRDAAAGTPVPSLGDFVVKACALALREHPRANGGYRDGRWELHSRVNVAVAVAVDGGVLFPTVFDADQKSLGEISRDVRELTDKVRDGSIRSPELSNATFTVSNLGMYGVRSFTAVITPPQAGVLAVGAVREAPVVREGQVVAGHLMHLTLTCDHRILYGGAAAEFLAQVAGYLENPISLTL